ncbi:hypothetical protein A9Q87_04585 [Flavobacteriales bacterium 34_180_T64]|nr:hypothetical protein A9Q87_04585 [Flavobacteriales bacterium 34_180_T64]
MAKSEANINRLLNYWAPPPNAGEPIACIATSFTFNSEFFEEECLSRFLQMDTDPKEDGPLYLIEREEKLAQVEPITIIVDEAHCKGKRSLRWDLISFRSANLLHSKIGILVWAGHIRILIGSCNLTENGYRQNREVVGIFDFNEKEGIDEKALNKVTGSLRLMLNQLNSSNPGVVRALKFVDRLPTLTIDWPRLRYPKGIERKVLLTGLGERPLLSQINSEIVRKRSFVNQANVVSPFYVAPGDANPAVKSLCKIIGKTEKPYLTWYGRTEEEPEDMRRLFYGPESLLTEAKANGVKNINFREIPETDKDEKGRKVHRSLHLKCIWLESLEYVYYCIGSSNFTTNGLGISKRPNFEANILYIINKAKNKKEYNGLKGSFPQSNRLSKRPNFCMELINIDERFSDDIKSLPLFFNTAVYKNEGDRFFIELIFDKTHSESKEWHIYDEGNNILYSSSVWIVNSEPYRVKIEWHHTYLPSDLKVVGEDQEEYRWAIIAEDTSVLPVPDELGDLELEILIQLLATNKPLHHALRKWLKKNNDTPELVIKELINPHDRVDVSGFLLRRTRRISYAFSVLKTQLERPYYTNATLQWRLNGPVGVMTLSKAIMKEAKSEEEKLFLLAELAIELSSLKVVQSNGCINPGIVQKELKKLIQSIVKRARKIENKNRMIQEYTADAFKKALNNV